MCSRGTRPRPISCRGFSTKWVSTRPFWRIFNRRCVAAVVAHVRRGGSRARCRVRARGACSGVQPSFARCFGGCPVVSFFFPSFRAPFSSLGRQIDSVIGRTSLPTAEQLDECTLLDSCLHETLRLWPPAPIFLRHATATHTIGEGTARPIVIPEGTDVLCNCLYVGGRCCRRSFCSWLVALVVVPRVS